MTAGASNGRPEVSIIVPTRDRPDRLPRTLLTALAQRDVEIEVVIVDDGSTEPVADHLTEAARQRVRVIRHDRPQGVAQARNAGIHAARGAWIALLDDDDLWAPTKLRRQLDAAATAGLELAFSAVVAVEADGRVAYDIDVPPSGTDLRPEVLIRNNVPAPSSNLLVRTELMRRTGGYDSAFSVLADWDLNVRLAVAGAAATVPQQLVAYVLHETNMHAPEAGLAEELERIDRKYAVERELHGVALDSTWWLTGRAFTCRRAGDRRGEAAALFELARVKRQPRLMVRPILLRLHGERILTATQRIRRRRPDARDQATPPWLVRALDPPVEDLRAIWQASSAQV